MQSIAEFGHKSFKNMHSKRDNFFQIIIITQESRRLNTFYYIKNDT